MPQNVFTRYQRRSHRYLNEINVNTKELHQIPTKTTNVRVNVNRHRICGVIFATVAVICVLLAMTLPFIINLNKNNSNTTITTLNSTAISGSNVTTTTNIITTIATTTFITSVTSTTTTSTDSTTFTTMHTTTTTASTTATTNTTSSTTTTTDTTTTTSTTTTDTTTSTTSVTTTTTTRNPYACSNMTVLVDYDLPGNDLTFQYTANYTLCCEFCLSNSSCMAYTWIVATSSSPCYLKLAAPSYTVSLGLISAHF